MAARLETLAAMHESRLVAVVRGVPRDSVEMLGRILASAGIRCIEVTLNTPGALPMIETLAQLSGVVAGAGTVLDPEGASAAIRAGARFIVSPGLNPEVVRVCRRRGAVAVPGALTPSEILAAAEAGGDLVKVFPAGSVGPGYIKELQGPLGHLDLMVTGGISAANAAAYLAAGATVLGVGGKLVDPHLVSSGQWDEIRLRAEELVKAVGQARPQA